MIIFNTKKTRRMKKVLISIVVSLMASISSYAQFTCTYCEQYGYVTGRSGPSLGIGSGTPIVYCDWYGEVVGKRVKMDTMTLQCENSVHE